MTIKVNKIGVNNTVDSIQNNNTVRFRGTTNPISDDTVKLSSMKKGLSNYNNYSLERTNKISFCGKKTVIAKNVKEKAEFAFDFLKTVVFSIPVLILSEILHNKNSEIEDITTIIQNDYEEHATSFDNFEMGIEMMNSFLDKHTKNEKYAQFVKEALSFLEVNFERYEHNYDRLKPFEDCNDSRNLKWHRFMYTIQMAAKAAIAKNYKNIDIEKLNKNIQLAKEIMQNQ